jgi:HEAT repeats/PQQ-like domain
MRLVSRLFQVRVFGMPWRRLAPILLVGLLLPWCAAPADDDPALLDFFRQRTVRANPDDLRRLIDQLGDNSFDVRERASERLAQIGAPALPALTQAATAPDAEVRRRADDCRRTITTADDGPEVRAAARLIAERRPPGAAAVLLDYLPARADESTAEALRTALVAVAVRDGRPESALIRALTDEVPARRAAAGAGLCRAGIKAQLPAVRKLLQDPDPGVRLRVGLALADLGEKDALPVLIALLDVLPRNLLAPVEDLLYAMGGAKSPNLAMGEGAAVHRKFREAWADWWTKEGAAADPRRARETPYLDHTIVLLLDRGKMIELDSDDRPTWEMTDLGFPLDLQVLPGERVLVADNQGSRVVERHRDGTILWEKDVSGPLMAQRLPDGNTFIATRSELLEVDRAGTIVFSYVRPDGEEFMRAVRLADGDIACVVARGTRVRHFVRLDPSGREKSRFAVNVQTYGGRIDVLPDGRVLIPAWGDNTVIEYDATGRALHTFSVEQPIAALRLSNGNTLITSMTEQRAIELDPAGKEIWQYRLNTRVTRALRR